MTHTKKVLITGANGMIGKRLTMLLLEKGFLVSHLVRTMPEVAPVPTFLWDPNRRMIDARACEGVDAIIHLAGAGIADRRWNARRKGEILQSRTETAHLLLENIGKQHAISTFISASGTSYYGLEDIGRPFVESDVPADDFMARVTVAWEEHADAFSARYGMRVVKIRTGVVLDRESIALRRISLPVKFFVGAALGTGRQFFNWIHIDDLCRMYIRAVEDPALHGVYNGVAPHPVTNRELTRQIAAVVGRPLWLPPVPSFIVKLIAGEVAEVVLKSGEVSSQKIQSTGFQFSFETLKEALEEIYSHEV